MGFILGCGKNDTKNLFLRRRKKVGEDKGWRTIRYHIIIAKKISRRRNVRPIDV